MTRCKAFYRKMKKLRHEWFDGDKKIVLDFCEKESSSVYQIYDHMVYMDKHFPNWLDEELESAIADSQEESNLLEECKIEEPVILTESATRPLRMIEDKMPEEHEEILEVIKTDIEEGKEVSASRVKDVYNKTLDIPFKPALYTIWNFDHRNTNYGSEGYKWGLIAGQIVENLLYYFTEEWDVVLDPMAGGGTTIDVCEGFNRQVLGFDIEPFRDDIIQHDITQPLDEGYYNIAQLVILEPPYYNMKVKDAYASIEEFYEFLRLAIVNSTKTLKPGGHLALILCDMNNDAKGTISYPMIGPAYQMLVDAGLTYRYLVGLPLSTQQKSRFNIEQAKKDKMLLNINRQMWMFRK